MVAEDYGPDVRARVVSWLAHCHERESGGVCPVDSAFPAVAHESPLRLLADAIVSDPAGDHCVTRLAERACVSERHLNRLFLAEMGMSPARYVQRVRVETARVALEHDDKSIETIAAECGFGTTETMRRAFGISPSSYRTRATDCTQC